MDKKEKKNKQPVRVSRVIGYGLLILGGLSVINFFSPIPIPTVGISALVSGFLFMAAGAVVLIPDKRGLLSRIRVLLRMQSRPAAAIDPLLPVRILKLAREHHGVLTVSTVAVELNIPLGKAQAGLDECVRSGQASADFDMEKEIKCFTFQEFLPPPAEKPDTKKPWDV
jgi:hypothetical protein